MGTLVLAGLLMFPRVSDYLDRQTVDRENQFTIQQIGREDVIAGRTDSLTVLPPKGYIDVPWFCQAPHENADSWKVHKESCEEAALLMVLYHLVGRREVNRDKIHDQLVDMIDWQMQNWGIHKDLHADSVKMLATGYFGFADEEIQIIRNASEDTLKSLIAQGFPVIIPTAGRMLGNPYFTPPGPIYHMVVVTGYTPDRVITNDIGTKRGKDFSYSWKIFTAASRNESGDVIILRVRSPKFPDRPAFRGM